MTDLPEDVRERARGAAMAKDDEDPVSPDGWIASVDAAATVAYEAGLAARSAAARGELVGILTDLAAKAPAAERSPDALRDLVESAVDDVTRLLAVTVRDDSRRRLTEVVATLDEGERFEEGFNRAYFRADDVADGEEDATIAADLAALLGIRGPAEHPAPGWAVGDPTHGRIDPDVQAAVDALEPEDVGQRVALENTLQNRKPAAGASTPVHAVAPELTPPAGAGRR